MLGILPKRLAEYDLRRQKWERRVGWYLTFQMRNQAAKMRFSVEEEAVLPAKGNSRASVPTSGAAPFTLTPQHSLKRKTVLQNSQVRWVEMARTNLGKVIRQWIETLKTLRQDGIVGDFSCLDGAADGSDLPVRNRLNAMLEYRYLFTPGPDLSERLRTGAEWRRASGG